MRMLDWLSAAVSRHASPSAQDGRPGSASFSTRRGPRPAFVGGRPPPPSAAIADRPDGTLYWNEVVLSPIVVDGAVTHFIGVQRDVSERVEAQREVQRLAERDALTGVANRRHMQRWLQRAATEPGVPSALLYVDVDALKEVNSLLGHRGGDQLLRQLAGRLTAAIRPTDLLARVGGDEFVIGLAPPVDAAGAEQAAERVIAAVRPPFELGGEARSVSVSVGVATSSHGDELLDAADAAMYRVKQAGGDGWAATVDDFGGD